MILFLRLVFTLIFLTMLAVTSWAGSQVPLWRMPREVGLHPWFIATLFDTYFAFLTFYLWVAYKETRLGARVLWFFLIMLLGNMAMATYMLILLFRQPRTATWEQVLLREKRG